VLVPTSCSSFAPRPCPVTVYFRCLTLGSTPFSPPRPKATFRVVAGIILTDSPPTYRPLPFIFLPTRLFPVGALPPPSSIPLKKTSPRSICHLILFWRLSDGDPLPRSVEYLLHPCDRPHPTEAILFLACRFPDFVLLPMMRVTVLRPTEDEPVPYSLLMSPVARTQRKVSGPAALLPSLRISRGTHRAP